MTEPMAEPGVSISLGAGGREVVKLNEVALAHHLGEAVRLDVSTFNGGSVVRLAVATCLFNVILKVADERRIEVSELKVTTDGDLGGDAPEATGIRYHVTVAGDATEAQLRELVDAAGQSSPVGLALPPGIPVAEGGVVVHTGA